MSHKNFKKLKKRLKNVVIEIQDRNKSELKKRKPTDCKENYSG